MSRSYKKTPGWADYSKSKRYYKRQSSKKVRRYNKELSNGNEYRKLYNSYDICDWTYLFYSKHEVLDYIKFNLKDKLYRYYIK